MKVHELTIGQDFKFPRERKWKTVTYTREITKEFKCPADHVGKMIVGIYGCGQYILAKNVFVQTPLCAECETPILGTCLTFCEACRLKNSS